MHVSPRPLRLPFEDDPAPPRTGLRSALVLALIALLTLGGVLLLSAYGISPPAPCGENFAAICDALE